ncbi:FecR family protein [Ravibacter arvi]|uniref:FecR family protein n=1 Tax=Ravibacter arvi TaxID=2051041 RepID=A0ABP8LY12_9BACT
MDDYRQYKAEQLAADASFRRWKLDQNKADALLWESWLLQHPDKLPEVEKAERLLETVFNSYDAPDTEEIRARMRVIASRLSDEAPIEEKEHSPRSLWRKLATIAAAVLLVGGTWWYLDTKPVAQVNDENHFQSTASERYLTKTNASGRKKLVLLPDGSTVLMMPNSTLRYPESFSGDTRDVRFSGEAFFEITRNPEQPFFVYTEKFITKVLGTSFTIRSYEGEEASVTVKTGSVSVFRASGEETRTSHDEQAVVLTPNERLTFAAKEELVVRKIPKERINASIGSRQTGLEFTRTAISEVFSALESVYQVSIRFDSTSMKNCFLTASLENEPFFKKLDLICRTIDARYQVNSDGDILVFGHGCD